MKPSTNRCISHQQLTSTSTADVKTPTIPNGTSHILLAVTTTSARVTLDGTAPSSTNGLVYVAAQQPIFIPVGQGITVKFASTAGTSSIVDLAYLQ